MPFVDAVKSCFAKFADFEGRTSRSEYWWFFLAVMLVSAMGSVLGVKAYSLIAIVTLLPMAAAGARRLHDVNRSGWWQLLALVPGGVFVVIAFLVQPTAPSLAPAEVSTIPQSPQ
jgi:uncharacterized membrane protein YhaH (DUF805 family)